MMKNVLEPAGIISITTGLSHTLNEFDVTAPIENWSITDLEVGSGYAAALAINGPVHGLNRFHFNP